MKTIKIAHLYYDLMNYFGEQGNITALKSAIKYADVKVSVDTLSIDDKIDFNAYDIFYIGMGSKINQELVRKDILKYKNDIKKIIDKKMFIAREQVFKTDLIDYPIIGFQNRESTNDIKENYLFEVIKGTGNDESIDVEGIHINNFFGTYLIGPLLIRNPYFKDELLKYLGISKFDETLPDYKAYYEYLKNFNIKTSSK